MSDFLSRDEYKQYWRFVFKEKTQSSASGVHFGHYKASSYDNNLSTLEAAKLSLATATGIPLARWGTGITVLLEKVPGNIHIDKMRAICLFKADYNYLTKFFFSNLMMNKALDAGIVPADQFAKCGSQANQGVVVSGLFCDIARSLHKTAAIESVDLANCYDAVAHPIVSIALQSFKVQKEMVKLMLLVLQITRWHLRTSFGQSKSSYGGTRSDPSMGLGQGNGAGPPAFTSQNTLMINGYKSLGHGVDLYSAWTGVLFTLEAMIFVDDSDLLHMVSETMSDEDFISKLQSATDDWAGIVNATGGSLKPPKCFWYMLSHVWKNGKPQLKRLVAQLPTTKVTILQPDGSRVPITLKRRRQCQKKTRGVLFTNGKLHYSRRQYYPDWPTTCLLPEGPSDSSQRCT